LHKKVSVDKDGVIRNCPAMPESFGNIIRTSIANVLGNSEITKYWNVTKDMVEICKDCEFRHICTDCRAYTERTHIVSGLDISKPLKCGYNPYTNVWSDWSSNPLKNEAIEYYGLKEIIEHSAE